MFHLILILFLHMFVCSHSISSPSSFTYFKNAEKGHWNWIPQICCLNQDKILRNSVIYIMSSNSLHCPRKSMKFNHIKPGNSCTLQLSWPQHSLRKIRTKFPHQTIRIDSDKLSLHLQYVFFYIFDKHWLYNLIVSLHISSPTIEHNTRMCSWPISHYSYGVRRNPIALVSKTRKLWVYKTYERTSYSK